MDTQVRTTTQAQRSQLLIEGPAGQIEITMDMPAEPTEIKGVALVSHPQPLLGGTPRHIVPHTLAKNLCADGWIAVRPAFRSVGRSDGTYAQGIGEAEDTLAVIAHMRSVFPDLRLALVGFSFGAYVYARAACELEQTQPVDTIALMGLPVGNTAAGRVYEALPLPARALLIHGQEDTVTPLANVLEWARAEHRPVVVFPGTDHFFKGCMDGVTRVLLQHLALQAA